MEREPQSSRFSLSLLPFSLPGSWHTGPLNIVGVLYAMAAVLPEFIAQKSGHIGNQSYRKRELALELDKGSPSW